MEIKKQILINTINNCDKRELENEITIKKYLQYLPERYHKEFVEDVLGSSPQTPKTIRKNWEMYWMEISDELNEDEKQIVYDNYLIIEL